MKDVLKEVLDKVPYYNSFKTFRELEDSTDLLVREYKDVVRVESIGRSRCGEEIRALIIGNGRLKALWFGAPHPNEPVGTLVLDYLSEKLASDDEFRRFFDYTWIIVKVADIDGLKMNEGWFKGPFTITHYSMNYYRPAGNVQIEWSFPIRYKRYSFENPVPETRALMNIIERYRPDMIYSLHNAGFGGVYYYISEEAPLLYPIFQFYPKSLGLPLSLGEPEVPWAVELSQAVYKMVSLKDYYDFLERQGMDPLQVIRHGGSSFDYAQQYNQDVVELVTEVPYYYDPRIEDVKDAEENISRREAILEALEWQSKIYDFIREVWRDVKKIFSNRDVCSESGRLIESIDYFVETVPKSIEAEKRWANTDPSLSRRAKISEVFDNRYVTRFYTALSLGMLRRLLNIEAEKISGLKPYLEKVEDVHQKILSYLESNRDYKVIEIRRLVQTQLAAGLYTALYIQTRRR